MSLAEGDVVVMAPGQPKETVPPCPECLSERDRKGSLGTVACPWSGTSKFVLCEHVSVAVSGSLGKRVYGLARPGQCLDALAGSLFVNVTASRSVGIRSSSSTDPSAAMTVVSVRRVATSFCGIEQLRSPIFVPAARDRQYKNSISSPVPRY